MKLLICIPTKTLPYYQDRARACEDTWLMYIPRDGDTIDDLYAQREAATSETEGARLNNRILFAIGASDVYYKFFSDADLGVDENDPKVRQLRTKLMAKYAYDAGYDFMFRVDADAYCYVNRLMASGFEQWDYAGNCLNYPKHLEVDKGRRTAHGGAGFTLSRKAMAIVKEWEPFPQSDGIYWGDIGAGELLWKHGIYCHRDSRFVDKGDGHFDADNLPRDHNYITVHPVEPEQMYSLNPLPDETHPIEYNEWDHRPDFNIGGKRPDICPCQYCKS